MASLLSGNSRAGIRRTAGTFSTDRWVSGSKVRTLRLLVYIQVALAADGKAGGHLCQRRSQRADKRGDGAASGSRGRSGDSVDETRGLVNLRFGRIR